jgi:hypothetical protein
LIPISEIASAIGWRHVVVFSFKCDVSFDGSPQEKIKGQAHVPITYAFAGFFADATTWDIVERAWKPINAKYGVSKFHGSPLNSRDGEYKGWDVPKQRAYSAELLAPVNAEGSRMYGISCGMLADEYRKIISDEGRRKMGSPYLACFNSCVALVAKMMDVPGRFSDDDKFAVSIDPDDEYMAAVESFYKMKASPLFPHRSRLAACAPLCMQESAGMQTADLVAYEVFKSLHCGLRKDGEPRFPLKSLMSNNVVNERYFGAKTFTNMKEQIESTPAGDGELVIIPES